MYRRATAVGRVATSLSRSHPAKRHFSESRPLCEDENKPRSRRAIPTDLFDSFNRKPATPPPKEAQATSSGQPTKESSAVPSTGPVASREPARTEKPKAAASAPSVAPVSEAAVAPSKPAAPPSKATAVPPPTQTVPQPAKASPARPGSQTLASAPPSSSPKVSQPAKNDAPPSVTPRSQNATSTAPSTPVPPVSHAQKTVASAKPPKDVSSPSKPVSPPPKTATRDAPAKVTAAKAQPSLATANAIPQVTVSAVQKQKKQKVVAAKTTSSAEEPKDDDALPASMMADYDIDLVDIDDIKLHRVATSTKLADVVVRKATLMARNPKYLMNDIKLARVTETVKQDVANAGWPHTTLNLQAALIRKVALDKFKKMRKRPPTLFRSLSGFLAQTVGARHSVRWPDGSYRPERSIGGSRNKLERAQIRVPTNGARLPPALVAATALPPKPVMMKHKGEIETDMFGFLRMRRDHAQWRQEVAGGDYTRFTAHIPVPANFNLDADKANAQLAVRSAFLALERNTTVTLNGKREVFDIYRDYVTKGVKLPDQFNEHPKIDVEELVDVLLAKKHLPPRLEGIIQAPKAIGAP